MEANDFILKLHLFFEGSKTYSGIAFSDMYFI